MSARPQGLRRSPSDWPNTYSFDQHSRDQYFSESRTKHRAGTYCRKLGARISFGFSGSRR